MRSSWTTSRPTVRSTSRRSSRTSTPTRLRRASPEQRTGPSADLQRGAAQLAIEGVQVGVVGPVDDDPAATALAALESDRNTECVLEAAPQREIVGRDVLGWRGGYTGA